MVNEVIDTFKAARRVGTPIIAVNSPDPQATIEYMQPAVDWVTTGSENPVPVMMWDAIRGALPVIPADTAAATAQKMTVAAQTLLPEGAKPEAFAGRDGLVQLINALSGPAVITQFVLFVINVHRYIGGPTVQEDYPALAQAIWNARNILKMRSQTLVLVGPEVKLPPELQGSILTIEEPLPDRDALAELAKNVYKAARVAPSEDDLKAAVDGVIGVAAFGAEQSLYMSMKRSGMNYDQLWQRKKAMLEQTEGLAVSNSTDRLDDVAGYENAKNFLRLFLGGRKPPKLVVLIDEIEKSVGANVQGDNTGVSQDQVGQILQEMENQLYEGALFVGPPGTGKTALAKGLGGEAGVPFISLDLGAMKGGIVGTSERNIRQALKVIRSVSDGAAVIIATSNDISNLPGALRRRFTLGTFYFDLPDRDGVDAIWKIWLGRFDLPLDMERANDENWVGADIRNCCRLAWNLDISLPRAATYITPVFQSNYEDIIKLRADAHGRYIDASSEGTYQATDLARPAVLTGTGGRQVDIQD